MLDPKGADLVMRWAVVECLLVCLFKQRQLKWAVESFMVSTG